MSFLNMRAMLKHGKNPPKESPKGMHDSALSSFKSGVAGERNGI